MHSRLDHINTHIFWLSPFITTYNRIAKSTSHLAGYMLSPRYRRIYVTIWPYQWINRAYVCLMGFLWPWGRISSHKNNNWNHYVTDLLYGEDDMSLYSLCLWYGRKKGCLYMYIWSHPSSYVKLWHSNVSISINILQDTSNTAMYIWARYRYRTQTRRPFKSYHGGRLE